MNPEQLRAYALLESIVSSVADIQKYVRTPNADIDPQLLALLVSMDNQLAAVAETT
jgi:hypothetical protein